jgi:membrane protease YdiL (CAAX protease family)
MQDRSGASLGVVLAGFALAAAALPWGLDGVGPVENPLVAGLALVAFFAFSLRRHGVLPRKGGSLVAGVASLGIAAYVTLAVSGLAVEILGLGSDAVAPSPFAAGLALVGGVGGVLTAYHDGRGFAARIGRAVTATTWAIGVGFAGLFAIAAWASVLLAAATTVLSAEPGTAVQLALSAVALGLGTGTIALVYFRLTEKTRSYLDVRITSMRDVGYVVAGVVALLGLQILVGVALDQLSVETASHSVQQTASAGNPEVLLLLIPTSWLIIGPGEELLYRNVIQKSLYDQFGKWGAVLVGSVAFALAHIPAYAAGASLGALSVTLVVIFLLSVVLGAAYLRTENVVVPALIHGTFDAVVFAAMYVQLTGTPQFVW